jgi:hypothetical protein
MVANYVSPKSLQKSQLNHRPKFVYIPRNDFVYPALYMKGSGMPACLLSIPCWPTMSLQKCKGFNCITALNLSTYHRTASSIHNLEKVASESRHDFVDVPRGNTIYLFPANITTVSPPRVCRRLSKIPNASDPEPLSSISPPGICRHLLR